MKFQIEASLQARDGVTMHQRPSLLVLALAAAPGAFGWSVVSHARPRWVRQRIGDVAMLEAYGACTPCLSPVWLQAAEPRSRVAQI